jgi:hypothetical protein
LVVITYCVNTSDPFGSLPIRRETVLINIPLVSTVPDFLFFFVVRSRLRNFVFAMRCHRFIL